jgi:hypothetical protein
MDNSRYQVMVFAMSASLQTGDGNLPVLRRRPLILGFLFIPHGRALRESLISDA